MTRLSCFLGLLALPVFAVIETYDFSSPELEERYHSLSQELRCPKCQNQNIAGSNAPISRDLRVVLHEQLEAGFSDDEILDFMVERYGEFVRYRPALDQNTAILWAMPVILILLGAGGLVFHFRVHQRRNRDTLDCQEREKIEALIRERRP